MLRKLLVKNFLVERDRNIGKVILCNFRFWNEDFLMLEFLLFFILVELKGIICVLEFGCIF